MTWSSDKAEYVARMKVWVDRAQKSLKKIEKDIADKEEELAFKKDLYARLCDEMEAIEFAIKELDK